MWKACERFQILPPEIKHSKWEEMNLQEKALLISYNQVRDMEGGE